MKFKSNNIIMDIKLEQFASIRKLSKSVNNAEVII